MRSWQIHSAEALVFLSRGGEAAKSPAEPLHGNHHLSRAGVSGNDATLRARPDNFHCVFL